ncbi:MAG: hypothetical protein ACXACT_16870 [Candidatus Thorarchaeota archaeon]|jgi:hypothetical protein
MFAEGAWLSGFVTGVGASLALWVVVETIKEAWRTTRWQRRRGNWTH